MQVYSQCGYTLTHVFIDEQIKPLHANLVGLGIELNVISNDEHVAEIECQSAQ